MKSGANTLRCPKCAPPGLLEVDPGSGERHCVFCGLYLPPYPLTWEGKNKQRPCPEPLRVRVLSLAQVLGNEQRTALALGITSSTIYRWRKASQMGEAQRPIRIHFTLGKPLEGWTLDVTISPPGEQG